jgi:hypothetical protein
MKWKSEKTSGDLVLYVDGKEAGRLTCKQLEKIKANKEDLFEHRERVEIKAGLDKP